MRWIIITVIILVLWLIVSDKRSQKQKNKTLIAAKECEQCNKEFTDDSNKNYFSNKIYCSECIIGIREEAKKRNEERIKEIEQKRREIAERRKIPPSKVVCPRCGSDQFTAGNKKLSVGRAIVGNTLAGPVGAVLGGRSSKQIMVTCLNCGKSWKAGKH